MRNELRNEEGDRIDLALDLIEPSEFFRHSATYKIAVAILSDSLTDARKQPRGVPEDERIGAGRERVIEVIGEAQWFLLDDEADDDAYGGFRYCCRTLGFPWRKYRAGIEADLDARGVTLPREERLRLAILAPTRRTDAAPRKKRTACMTRGCRRFAMDDQVLCRMCLHPRRDLPPKPCVKCGAPCKKYSPSSRRIYCKKCGTICIRDGCTNQRRSGLGASTCAKHHREYRQGVLARTRLHPYRLPTTSESTGTGKPS